MTVGDRVGVADPVGVRVAAEVFDDDEVPVGDGVPVLVGVDDSHTGARATPRKSVFVGACATGQNTADAEVGLSPGMYRTTTFPPTDAVPGAVQMYST